MTSQDNFAFRFAKHKDELDTLTVDKLESILAFANKAVTVVWGLVWGALFFREAVTPGKLLGAALVIVGVILFERADGEAAESETDHG